VNGSIEIHGEQQVQQLVAQLVWQHVASVKALLASLSSVICSGVASIRCGRGGGTKLDLNENNLSHKNDTKYIHLVTIIKLQQLLLETAKCLER